jgi:hypothetical protein
MNALEVQEHAIIPPLLFSRIIGMGRNGEIIRPDNNYDNSYPGHSGLFRFTCTILAGLKQENI